MSQKIATANDAGTLLSFARWCLAIAALFAIQGSLSHVLVNESTSVREERSEAPWKRVHTDPRLYRILSVGHLPIATDWLWLSALADSSMLRLPKGEHPAVYYQLDLVTQLDPAFDDAYTGGATIVGVIRKDGPGALAIAERGEKFRTEMLPAWPQTYKDRHWRAPWMLPITKAYLYIYEMQDIPKAAQAFKDAAAVPGAPEYLKQLVQRLSKPTGYFEIGLRILSFMANGVHNEQTRQELREKERSLRLALELFQLNLDFRDFLKQTSTSARRPGFLNAQWETFRRTRGVPEKDRQGGRLYLHNDGTIRTTTVFEQVLGLHAF